MASKVDIVNLNFFLHILNPHWALINRLTWFRIHGFDFVEIFVFEQNFFCYSHRGDRLRRKQDTAEVRLRGVRDTEKSKLRC